MNVTEEAVTMASGGDTLIGVLTRPQRSRDTAVVIIVGGPQYRAGSHRQFVLLSRVLADHGFPALRFDYRGRGDSAGAPRSFEDASGDIGSAIDALQQRLPGVRRVVLWGLCDGASAALLYQHDTQDRRVTGLCLLNPWVRSETSLAQMHVRHYYAQRLLQREFWTKLLSGRIGLKAAGGLAQSVRTAAQAARVEASTYQARMAAAWRHFDGRILLLLSEHDYTAKEFADFAAADPAWKGTLTQPGVTRRTIAGADHTFSSSPTRRAVEQAVLEWLPADMHPPAATTVRAGAGEPA